MQARRLLTALEDVRARAKTVGLCLRRGDLVGELGDLRLERLLHFVGFDDRLSCERLPVVLGEPICNLGGKLGIDRRDANADRPALLWRIDLDAVEESGEHPVVLGLAGPRRADPDQAQN